MKVFVTDGGYPKTSIIVQRPGELTESVVREIDRLLSLSCMTPCSPGGQHMS